MIAIEKRVTALSKVNVYVLLQNLNIFNSVTIKSLFNLILVTKVNIHINGPLSVVKTHVCLSIIKFQLCDLLFSGEIKFHKNYAFQIISLDTHIKLMNYGIYKH